MFLGLAAGMRGCPIVVVLGPLVFWGRGGSVGCPKFWRDLGYKGNMYYLSSNSLRRPQQLEGMYAAWWVWE